MHRDERTDVRSHVEAFANHSQRAIVESLRPRYVDVASERDKAFGPSDLHVQPTTGDVVHGHVCRSTALPL